MGISESIEASTTDYLFYESLLEIGALFVTDEDVYFVEGGEGVEEFLEEDFAEETSGTG